MGVSGIDTDIVTGRPRQVTREEHQAQEELKETRAMQEAVQISQELPSVLPIVARQLESRLLELMRADAQCLSILQIIGAFRLKIDLGPQVAAKIRRQSFGIVLNSMTDETKVAPEGIPAEE
jgi:hypothetical protein